MTKKTESHSQSRNLYCVRFMSTTCYKVTLQACSEQHAVALAKKRWYHGSPDSFVPYSGDTDAWDAEIE